jgi:hypothetical protein
MVWLKVIAAVAEGVSAEFPDAFSVSTFLEAL